MMCNPRQLWFIQQETHLVDPKYWQNIKHVPKIVSYNLRFVVCKPKIQWNWLYGYTTEIL